VFNTKVGPRSQVTLTALDPIVRFTDHPNVAPLTDSCHSSCAAVPNAMPVIDSLVLSVDNVATPPNGACQVEIPV
jgi:hypothetical protein